MKTRSLFILAALVMGLNYQSRAQAHTIAERNSDCSSQVTTTSDGYVPEQDVPQEDTPSDTPSDEDGKVCFCHNITHHPQTICTSDEGLINGHMKHVNGEVPGVQDTLGKCEVEATPTPTDEPSDGDATPPPVETDEPAEGTPLPNDNSDTGNDTTKVDGYEPASAIASDGVAAAVVNPQSGMFFEGSGGGCSLAGTAGGSDLAAWAFLVGTAMFSTLIRRRK